MRPIADLAADFVPERDRIIAGIGLEPQLYVDGYPSRFDSESHEERLLVHRALAFGWALWRVEFDFHDDPWAPSTPYDAAWLYAFEQQWSDAASLGEVRDFHTLHEEGRALWLEAHPEWEAQRRAEDAERAGRLF